MIDSGCDAEQLQRLAALAQLVERRLGKAEVGGSNPLGSLITNEFIFIEQALLNEKKCLPCIYIYIQRRHFLYQIEFLLNLLLLKTIVKNFTVK